MKFYSETLKHFYDSEKECVKAEKEYEEKIAEAKRQKELKEAEKANRKKEVDAAYEFMNEAKKKYNEVLHNYVKDYNSYEYKSEITDKITPNDWIDFFFNQL